VVHALTKSLLITTHGILPGAMSTFLRPVDIPINLSIDKNTLYFYTYI